MEIWWKAFSMLDGGRDTFRIEVTRACLYGLGYLHCFMLLQMISFICVSKINQYGFHCKLPIAIFQIQAATYYINNYTPFSYIKMSTSV